MRSVFLALTFISSIGFAKEITKDLLMEGSPIPAKREFPLSTKIQACQDFHAYACDEAEQNFKLPEDRSTWTFSFTDNAERILFAKKKYFKLLSEGYAPKTPRAAQLADYYLACMDAKARKTEEKQKVASEKKVWTGLDREQLKKLVETRLGEPDYTPVEFGTIANQDDPTKNDAYLMAAAMTLPERSYYEKKEAVDDLRDLAKSFFTTIGMDKAAERAQWVIDYETSVAKAFPLPAEMRQRVSSNTYISRADWAKKYPALAVPSFFQRIPADAALRDLAPDSAAFVSASLDTESLDKLKSVFIFHALKDILDDGYPDFQKKHFAFQKKHLGGPAARPPREERCTRAIMGHFEMEFDEELISILFPNFPEDRVVKTVEKVRGTILADLKRNEWLSKDAKKEAIKKIESASLKLVKPKTEEDWNFLPIQKYDRKSPLGNLRSVSKAEIEREFKDLREKRNRNRWGMGPLTMNAYFNPPDNQFVLLQGILQSPFFDESMSDTEVLGAIGAVTGHELGHSVDDQGAKYDASGKLHQWMSMKDLAEFSKRSEKLVDRYEKLGHNGHLTLGENIGDHVGLQAAFETAFPGGKPSPEEAKKFYLAFARMWCSVQRPEYRALQLKTNPHALGWARINGQVVDHEAFTQAFQCKAGDPMYVDKKDRVEIW